MQLAQIGGDVGIIVRRVAVVLGQRQRACEDVGVAVDTYDALPDAGKAPPNALARVSGSSSKATRTRA